MSFDLMGPTSRVLVSALDGISLRQRVIADNIANVDTPHFRATSVDFESMLRKAIDDGDFETGALATADPRVAFSATPTLTPVGPDGNNVDLRKETMAAIQSQFQYQTMTRAVGEQFERMRTSIGA